MGVITEAKANEYKTLLKAFNPAQTSTASQDSAKKAYQPSTRIILLFSAVMLP